MTSSTYEQPLPPAHRNAAQPFDIKGEAIVGGAHTYPEMAAAGLWTTPSDLVRYMIEVRTSLDGTSNHVLSQAMTKQMLTPGIGDWGLGVQVSGTKDNPAFEHDGANAGFRNAFIAYTKSGDGVAVMTNGDAGGELGEEITRAVAAEYGWQDHQPIRRHVVHPAPDVMSAYTGRYAISPTFNADVRVEGDHLTVQATNQPAFSLMATTENRYLVIAFDAEFEFFETKDGEPAYLIMHQNGKDTRAVRIGPVPD